MSFVLVSLILEAHEISKLVFCQFPYFKMKPATNFVTRSNYDAKRDLIFEKLILFEFHDIATN